MAGRPEYINQQPAPYPNTRIRELLITSTNIFWSNQYNINYSPVAILAYPSTWLQGFKIRRYLKDIERALFFEYRFIMKKKQFPPVRNDTYMQVAEMAPPFKNKSLEPVYEQP